VARYVVLDTTPLGLASTRRGHPQGDVCRAWLDRLRLGGVRVVVPEVADYEVRRELLRVGAVAGVRRLDALASALVYAPVTTAVMRQAAAFWADVRRRGLPTAADPSLDGDAVLAAQAALLGGPGDVVEVATANAAHLARFPGVDAREWVTVV
jgi:predicted nucleic acid-binding protein